MNYTVRLIEERIKEIERRDSYQSLQLITADDYHQAHADRRWLLVELKATQETLEEAIRFIQEVADHTKAYPTRAEAQRILGGIREKLM